MSIQSLSFTPDALSNSSFGIYISDSPRENEIFSTLQQLSQALIQNDKATFSDIIKTLRSNSIEELESFITSSEKQSQQLMQQQQEQQIQAQLQLQQDQQQFEMEMQARDHANKIEVEEIRSFSRQMDQDVNDNQIPDQFEIEKFKTDAKLKERKLNLEERKLNQDAKFKEQELQIKRKAASKPKK